MSGTKLSFVLAVVIGAIAPPLADAAAALTQKPKAPGYTEPQDPTTLREISGLYRRLIEAENRHDLALGAHHCLEFHVGTLRCKDGDAGGRQLGGVLGHRCRRRASWRTLIRPDPSGSIRTTTRKGLWA
jgi:hypothetical protein